MRPGCAERIGREPSVERCPAAESRWESADSQPGRLLTEVLDVEDRSSPFVVEDRGGALRLRNPDTDGQQTCQALGLLYLDSRLALDVREQRNQAGERKHVVLGGFHIENFGVAQSPGWVDELLRGRWDVVVVVIAGGAGDT